MIVRCTRFCGVYFDDEFRTTICPHETFAANNGQNAFAHHPESYRSSTANLVTGTPPSKPWHLTTYHVLSFRDRLRLLFGGRLFVRFRSPDGHCHAACEIAASVQHEWPADDGPGVGRGGYGVPRPFPPAPAPPPNTYVKKGMA